LKTGYRRQLLTLNFQISTAPSAVSLSPFAARSVFIARSAFTARRAFIARSAFTARRAFAFNFQLLTFNLKTVSLQKKILHHPETTGQPHHSNE
jgi:hypothetical protein